MPGRATLTSFLTTLCLAVLLAACDAGVPEPAKSAPAGDEAERSPRGDGREPDGPVHLGATRPGEHPVVWVRKGERVEVRTEPGGGELVRRAGRRTEFGSTAVFGVLREVRGWVGVSTPHLPNGRLGWIELDKQRLRGGSTPYSIVVDLSERRARLLDRRQVARSFAVTVGAPGSETPTGRFAVTDSFRGDLNPVYGCCALALSATQPNVPSGWLGGNRIAIHGTDAALGAAASHGCVRAADADVSKLVDRVPLGTPVVIRA